MTGILNSSVVCTNDLIIGQTNSICYGYAKGNLIATEIRNLSPDTFNYLHQSFLSVKADNYFLFLIMYIVIIYLYLRKENKDFSDNVSLFIASTIIIFMTINILKVL